MNLEEIKASYPVLLKKYLFEEDKEVALYEAYNMGQECFKAKISIEEIMNIHTQSLESILKELPPSISPAEIQDMILKSSNLLIEFSIKFGLICQNYFDILQQTDERIRDAFYQTGEALTAGLDIHKMLPIILNLVKNLTNATGCAIKLFDEDRTIIEMSAGFKAKNDIFNNTIFEEVAKERKAKFVYDLKVEKNPVILEDGREIRSVLGLPLNFKQKTLGVLGIYMIQPHHYGEKEITLLSSFAYEAASAINNAYLFTELQKHDKTLQVLYDIGTVVGQSLDLKNIFNEALNKTIRITETDSGGIYLLDQDGNTLTLQSHFGISDELASTISKIRVGQGVTGIVAKTGRPQTTTVSMYPSSEILPSLLKEGIVSIASTPLKAKGKVVGVITLGHRKFRHFSTDDMELLASIGNHVGVAIENSRLFNEVEKHHKILDTLYSIESVVSRSLNLGEIFEVALSKALEVTDTQAGTLYSFDGKNLHLEVLKGLSPEFKEKATVRELGEGIPGIAAQSQKPITLDISNFPSHYLVPFVKQEGLVSFIGTPLLSKGKLVGSMALGTKKKKTFTQEDLDLLYSIGNIIGIAAENARLYEESTKNLKKLELAYEELKTLDKMKDEFISNVSHELKTPLISIKGYGELLNDEKQGKLSSEQKKSLEAIIRNADRLTRLINSILFISKMQFGKIEFQLKTLDVDEIISVCVDDMKGMMDKKKISFEKDIHVISKIVGDKDRFIEIITNLLDNAIKFTPEGGNISIKARDKEEFVHIIVSDNGIGIPSDIIPKLFTRFYQVDASTARKYMGTGLGLYITRNIIEAFKGKIWIESEVGKGTDVHLLIPAAKG
ncbi:MAG: GAF domain-containing protein [Candidatus Methanoperedenaceae archaeon]|nr:GAF domain-containing protein [Candidatus Methanoperedenaceae archaeon]